MESMKKLQTVLDLYLKHRITLGYGLVTLLTVGGERIFSTAVFQCPCSAAWNLTYGLVFLLVPALALFLLGYVLSARTWRLLTGCCKRGADDCAASGSRFLARRLCSDRSSQCAEQLPLVPCNKAQESDVQGLLTDLKAQSQVLGWILIAAVIVCLLIIVSITRCVSPVSFLQLSFWKIYVEQEQKILRSQATEHATELANENVKCFFEGSHPKECKTPSMKDWQQVSELYTFNPKNQYYSMLHKYVNREEKNRSIRISKGDAVVPVLGFVDAHGMHATAEL
ncbi:PREDICTED: protein FAM26F [Myotis brandtii]|uniref:protein FAM26F n=1 Tax=Myotis brandtii TaxID=109478 RepID=UPI0003BC027D|nr:PREDICTED: protein FAM26F [Myotis brandtii]